MFLYKINKYDQIDVHVCLLHQCSESLVLRQTLLNRMLLFWTTVHRVWQQTASPHISAAIVRRLSCWMWPVAPDWWQKRWTYKTKSDPLYKIWHLCRSQVCLSLEFEVILVNVKTCSGLFFFFGSELLFFYFPDSHSVDLTRLIYN